MATGTISKHNKGLDDIVTLGSGGNLNNLNKLKYTGLFYVTTNVANSPTAYAILLNICMNEGGFTQQIIFRNNENIYMRSYSGNPIVWTAWKHCSFS